MYMEILDDVLDCQYFGKLKTTAPIINLSDKTIVLDSEHIIAALSQDTISFKLPDERRGLDTHSVKIDLGGRRSALSGGISPNQTIVYDCDQVVYSGRAQSCFDFTVNYDYFEQQPDRLTFLGDFMRSFAAVGYWRNNQITVKGRKKLLAQQPIALKDDDILDIRKMHGWDRYANRIVLQSMDAVTGANAEYAGSILLRYSAGSRQTEQVVQFRVPHVKEKNKLVKEIEANIIANCWIRKSNGTYDSGSEHLANSDINIYLPWYKRQANVMESELAGVSYYPGMLLTIPSIPGNWLIEESWKDFAKKTTEVNLVNMAD